MTDIDRSQIYFAHLSFALSWYLCSPLQGNTTINKSFHPPNKQYIIPFSHAVILLSDRQLGKQTKGRSGLVRHVAILSIYTKMWGSETYLETACHEFFYMSTQWLHC